MITEKIIKSELNKSAFILRTEKYDYLFAEKSFLGRRDNETGEVLYTYIGKDMFKSLVDSTFEHYKVKIC